MAFGGSRTVKAVLDADVGGYVAKMRLAATATRDVARQAAKSAAEHKAAWDDAGRAMVGFGAVAVGAVGLAAREAIAWESAWAGVRKTVDGSDAEMAALERELRGLAKTLPATHQEIAAVAEAAGQLGVKREAIVGFTRTMIALGETTNLSADEAATSIAQMANIMGTSQGDVDRLGAALVALGNDGASTERDIIRMAQRIAGAGNTIGLTEGEVLGFANALASMGVEVEAGGTAISRVMLTIDKAVSSGGDDLERFARVAGMSADEFAAAFEADAASAIAAFVDGLGRADRAGENTTQILEDLELGEIRVSDALRRLSANSGLLTDSLALGNRAWGENRALVEEAAKRYDTTAAQIQIAQNNIRDAAITVGESLLPALSSAADAVVGLVEGFQSLPEPLQRAAGPIATLIGGVSLLGGGFLLLTPRIAETIKAFKTLRQTAPGVATGLGRIGKAAAGLALFTAAGAAVSAFVDNANTAVLSASEATSVLLDLADGVGTIDAQIRALAEGRGFEGFESLEEGLRNLADPSLMDRLNDASAEILGFVGLDYDKGRPERDALIKQLESFGQGLATLVQSGQADEAARQFEIFKRAAADAGVPIDDLLDLMPAYRDAVADADNQQRIAADGSDELASGLGGVAEKAQQTKAEVDSLVQALVDAGLVQLSTRDAARALEQAIDDAAAAIDENGTSMDITTEKGRANQAALDQVARSALTLAQSVYDETGSEQAMRESLAQSREALITTAEKFLGSREAAEKYADQVLGTPKSWATTFTTPGLAEARAGVASLREDILRLPNGHTTTITTRYVVTGDPSGASSARSANPFVRVGSAAGNYFPKVAGGVRAKAFASGDVRDGHVAQIAPAGAWRVWAEDETGGEAYTPLANDWRRPRAVQITRTVADLFGFELVPKAQRVAAFDRGGYIGPAGGGASGPVRALVDRGALASAFDGVHLTLEVDGRPVRAVVRAELAGQNGRAADGRR